MNEQRVSSRYARALFEKAKQDDMIDQVYKDLLYIRDYIKQSKDLRLLVNSPIIRYSKKEDIFSQIFEKNIDPVTHDFLILVFDKRREKLIPSITAQYEILYNILNGRLPIKVYSAVDLSDDIKNKIISKMQENTGKTVITEFAVDSDLKGGLKVRIEDWVFDSTIKNQLEKLFHSLTNG